MRRVLTGMGAVPIAHNEDKDNSNGGESGGGNCIEDNNNNDDAVGKGKLSSLYSLCNVRAIRLMNLGANCNLAKLFHFSSSLSASSPGGGPTADVRCYVLECHQPYHLANKYASKNMVLFNNRPFEDGEVPSNTEDLSGDKMSKDSNNDDNGRSGGGGTNGREDNGRKAG